MPLPFISHDEIAWLQAIHNAPNDPQLRTVFADWLQEQGQAQRAAIVLDGIANSEAFLACPVTPSAMGRAEKYHAELVDIFESYRVDEVTLAQGFLTSIRLPADSFVQYGHELIAWAPTCRSARVHAQWNQLTNVVESAALAELEHLELVEVRGGRRPSPFGDEALLQLSQSPTQHLKSLRIAYQQVTESGLMQSFADRNWEELRRLDLEGCSIDGSFLPPLQQLAKLPNLEKLSLLDLCAWDDQVIAGLRCAGWPALHRMQLGASIGTCRNLEEDELERQTFIPFEWRSFIRDPNERRQHFWDRLRGASIWSTVKSLQASGMGIMADAARNIFPWLLQHPLEELHLDHNPLTSAGVAPFCESRSPTLRNVCLDYCDLNDEALWHLARANCMGQLQVLSVSNNLFGERGIYHLTQASFWQTLRRLDLSQTDLEDVGIAALTTAPEPGALQSLLLDECQLTDRAADCLASWSALARLKHLSVRGNQFTELGAAALEDACRSHRQLLLALRY